MSRFAMRRLDLKILLSAALVPASAGLVAAAPASASSGQVLADCNSNGHLSGHYSSGDLQGALNGMGADTQEYTNCYDVVRRALLANVSGGGHSGGGPGSPGGQAQHGANGSATSAGAKNGASAGSVTPTGAAGHSPSHGTSPLDSTGVPRGTTGVNAGSSARSLPAPLIGVLVLLAIGALGGGGIAVRRRVLTRHGA